MSDPADKKSKQTCPTSARLYAIDVAELKRRAAEMWPGNAMGWTVFLREFLHEQLSATKRKKKIQ